jgi:hypothetical protein
MRHTNWITFDVKAIQRQIDYTPPITLRKLFLELLRALLEQLKKLHALILEYQVKICVNIQKRAPHKKFVVFSANCKQRRGIATPLGEL